jgi:hypothetical protein
MFQIYKDTKVYVLCPSNFATGGTELAHQLVHKLRAMDINSIVYYFDYVDLSTSPVNERFKKYDTPYTNAIDDVNSNILITPEIYTQYLYGFKQIRKGIWWLSVDGYFPKGLRRRLKQKIGITKVFKVRKHLTKSDQTIQHFVQSEYARNFLTLHNISSEYLSDYLNPEYINKSASSTLNRENIVLYNPKKGLEFTKKLIDCAPEINWKPLINMSPAMIADALSTSKIYIDFGNHPGKDRFPREAAIMGCCVVTGLRGSANNEIDIPIPSKYKFDEKRTSAKTIVEFIKELFQTYETRISDFANYRSVILNEEKEFEKSLQKIFVKTS